MSRSSVSSADVLIKRLQGLPEAINKPVRQAIAARALDVETDAKQSVLGGGKTGREYKRGKNRIHQASAAGEAPASDTGRLVSAISHKVTNGGLDAEIGVFGSIIDDKGKARNYARDLEFGTSKMAARPFLFPALEKNKQKIRSSVARAVGKVLKDSSL